MTAFGRLGGSVRRDCDRLGSGLFLTVCGVEWECAFCSRLAMLGVIISKKSVVAVCGVLLLCSSLGMVALSNNCIIVVVLLFIDSWKVFAWIERGEDISLISPD